MSTSGLPYVEIPGFRDAVRRERAARDVAWLDGTEILCGVEVVQMSLRRMVWLDHARCGFICPWRFDSEEELLAHAVLFLWMMRPNYSPPASPRISMARRFIDGYLQHQFTRSVLRHGSILSIVGEIREWLDTAFMDAPVGDASGTPQSYASYPTYVFDRLAAAGYNYSMDAILDMPIARLWQLWRVASARNGAKLTNPSDDLATKYLASLGGNK